MARGCLTNEIKKKHMKQLKQLVEIGLRNTI